MQQLNRTNFDVPSYPTRIMQFGEGNFLRAFVDWQIDCLNEQTGLNAGVAIIRPIDSEYLPLLDTQDGLYTTIVRGIDEQGNAVANKRVISSVNEEVPIYRNFERYLELAEDPNIEFVFSNTTEAGIEFIETDRLSDAPAQAFPAKLTQWLYHRFRFFEGDSLAGVTVIPCELIDYNGEKLKEIILKYCQLWDLEPEFENWLESYSHFCSTLVDRIVTGFPRDEHQALQEECGYLDSFMVTCEYFHLFVIQGPADLKERLNIDQSDLNILVVDDIYPYKQRKVAILNGAHTAMVPLAFLSGLVSVKDAMDDETLSSFVETIVYSEIIPTLNLQRKELEGFAEAVLKRFQNPYIHHQLLSISLNSMTKFRTRLVPQLRQYSEQFGSVPPLISLAIAGQILFYRGRLGDQNIPLQDDKYWLDKFSDLWTQVDSGKLDINHLVEQILGDTGHWEGSLLEIPGLLSRVTTDLSDCMSNGVKATVAARLGSNNE